VARGELILAIDQGTSSTKCLVLDRLGGVVAQGAAPLGETCPMPGWVEQDPEAIWRSVGVAVADALSSLDPMQIGAVGFSTQRESLVLWDKGTGEAISPLVSWQDQRTRDLAGRIGTRETREAVRRISGLPLDPMFSALKATWLLDACDPDRKRARAGEIALGTVDAWLLFRLGGEHVIELGNASRTQLLDTASAAWSDELCDLFRIPKPALPRILPSTGPFPAIRGLAPLPDGLPVAAVMGDSHAALFGHGARSPGAVKATFGTGSSVMGLVGDAAGRMDPGICLTIGWQLGDDRPAFAAEGNIRSAGSTLRWLSDVFAAPIETLLAEAMAQARQGVHLVPAFNGLGAPYWDDAASAVICDFKLGTRRGSIARAALESIPHQVADVVEAIERTIGAPVDTLFADGGPSMNDDLMQMQADFAELTVLRSQVAGLSAIGAAHMAGLSAGLWSDADLAALERDRAIFAPAMEAPERSRLRESWRRAVARSRFDTHADGGENSGSHATPAEAAGTHLGEEPR
jgi:glycerol kinase